MDNCCGCSYASFPIPPREEYRRKCGVCGREYYALPSPAEQELADLKQLVRWAVKEYDKGDDVWGAIQKLRQAVEDKTNLPSWSNDAY